MTLNRHTRAGAPAYRPARIARTVLATTSLLLGSALPSGAQRQDIQAMADSAMAHRNLFNAGFGVTWIDGEPFILVNFSPEFGLGRLGVGLDANLRFHATDGKFYEEDWKHGNGPLKAIRYVRWGQKRDGGAVYVRAGELDAAQLGYGQVLYQYRNSPSYDNRKRGLELDVDAGWLGVETVYGNLAKPEVAAGRVYARPLRAQSIPIVSRLEVGLTAAADLNDRAGLAGSTDGAPFASDDVARDRGHPVVLGADIGLPLARNALGDVTLYSDVAKLKGGGAGGAIGAQLALRALGLARLSARVEHRILGDQYTPSFFDALYEIDRYRAADAGGFTTRYNQVLGITSSGNGVFGELTADVLRMLIATGSYQRLYAVPNSGWLHLGAGLGQKIPKVVLRASYDHRNIGNDTDLLKLDGNSIALLETGYELNRFTTLSLFIEWTFAPVRDAGGAIIDYVPQKRIEPRISFGMRF